MAHRNRRPPIGPVARPTFRKLLFLGPTGAIARKAEDLENYRRGRQRITKVEPRELAIELFGDDVGVVTVITALEGVFDEKPFSGTYRYVRTWRRDGERWQIIAGAVMAPISSPTECPRPAPQVSPVSPPESRG